MPEIGDQLRETRMRNRIDITEVEAATKIRAKYLRALENEEWDLLPGPTFVKTFLRTYADYLGLDARMLVEEYRQRYERPGGQELTPFGTNLGGRRARPRRPLLAPVDGARGRLPRCSSAPSTCSARWGDDPPEDEQAARARRHADAATATARSRARASRRRQADPGAAADRRHRAGQRLPGERRRHAADRQRRRSTPGQSSRDVPRPAASACPSARAPPSCASTASRIEVSDDAPIGYELRPGGQPRPLPEARRPTCSG